MHRVKSSGEAINRAFKPRKIVTTLNSVQVKSNEIVLIVQTLVSRSDAIATSLSLRCIGSMALFILNVLYCLRQRQH